MPARPYSHIATAAREFSEYLRTLGYADRDIFRNTGLDPAAIHIDGARASLPAIAALFDRGAKLTGNSIAGLEWGLQRRATRLGLIGYMGRTSPNLLQLLHNLARFRRVFSEPMNFDISNLADQGQFRWTYQVPSRVDVAQFAESQAAHMFSAMSRAVQRQLRPKSLSFAHPRTDCRDAFQRAFGCPVSFGGPRYEIQWNVADLGLPIITSDEHLHRILKQHCEIVLAQTPSPTDDIQVRVERAIADRLASGQASQDQVARDIGMSTRTLARRLGSVGTSYQRVLAALRLALAERYLREGNISQSEIAYLLGYSDVSSFASAFKRWTGRSPGEIRQGSA